MESLHDSTWDVIISGTGLPQALLALSLSRSGKKILHVDKNKYYGENDAAFTLLDAEQWAESINAGQAPSFTSARIVQPTADGTSQSLHPALSSKAYSLSITPQIIYAKSKLLQSLVSSQVHTQLEFLAVGSWWTYINGVLRKIPASREDIFLDDGLSRREKGALMKLLRFVAQESEAEDEHTTETLSDVLWSRFSVPSQLHGPLLALSLSQKPSESTKFDFAMSRIRRHVQSLGVFGAGFGAVIPKYGGNAEIAQVACRACAVGGGVYVLGQSIKMLATLPTYATDRNDTSHSTGMIEVELSTGEKVKAGRVLGSAEDLPQETLVGMTKSSPSLQESLHSISIISNPLAHLLPPISDTGPPSAVAIILVDDRDEIHPLSAPVYLQVHSEETGECPRGQCVIYGSVLHEDESSRKRLEAAIDSLIRVEDMAPPPTVLWSIFYTSKRRSAVDPSNSIHRVESNLVSVFPVARQDLSSDDSLHECVQAAWSEIMEEAADEAEFLRFAERGQGMDDD